MSRLPATAILGQALVGRPGADYAARPGPRRQPVAEVLAEHPLKQSDVVLERRQQRLALLPAKRLPFLATVLQENRYGRERQRGQKSAVIPGRLATSPSGDVRLVVSRRGVRR